MSDKMKSALRKLVRPNALSFYALFLMWAVLTLLYYFGEIVDYAQWNSLRWSFFYTVHDTHRLLFLIPVVYAAYIFGIRAAIIITIISLMTFLPRALFISTFPDPIARMGFFVLTAGFIGVITALAHTERRKRTSLQSLLATERDQLRLVLSGMQEGVMIIGPDYRIRYMNPSLTKEIGAVSGSYCYQVLQGVNMPCGELCKLSAILNGKAEKSEYTFQNGKHYEVSGLPFQDADTLCWLIKFKKFV